MIGIKLTECDELNNLSNLFKSHYVKYRNEKNTRFELQYILEITSNKEDSDLLYRVIYNDDYSLVEKKTNKITTEQEKILDLCFTPEKVVSEIRSDLYQLALDLSNEPDSTYKDYFVFDAEKEALPVFSADIDEMSYSSGDFDYILY